MFFACFFRNLIEDYDGEKPLKISEEEKSPEAKKKLEKRKRIKPFPTPKPVKKVKFQEDIETKQIKENKDALVSDFLKSENDEQGMQSFGEKIEFSIDLIKKTYDVDDLRLKFIQAKILLKENSPKAFLDKIFDALITSLKLENEIQVNFTLLFPKAFLIIFFLDFKTENFESIPF